MRYVDYTNRVYAWHKGDMSSAWPMIDHETAEEYISSASWQYRAKPPTLYEKKRGNRSFYLGKTHSIYLVPHHFNQYTVLHETSHGITMKRFGQGGHCKTWLGVFQFLLTFFQIIDKKHLKASMTAYDLPWVYLSPSMAGIR